MGKKYDAEDAARRINELEKENILLKNRAEFLEFFNESSSSWETFRDKDGRLIYISSRFEEISGYSRKDFLSGEKDLINIAHPEDSERLQKLYHKHISGQENDDFNFRLIKNDGSMRYITSKFRPVFNKNGEFIGTRLSCQDITKLQQTEEAFNESETKLKTIFDNSNDGIILIDENGIITDWNARVEKVTGFSKDKAIGNYVWDIQYRLIAKEQKKSLSVDFLSQAWLKEVFSLKMDESTSGFGEIVTIGGKVEYIEDLVKPVMIGNKRFYCIFQHYVTEQKHNERLLVESEDKFEKVFNLSPVPIALARCRDTVYIEVNEAFSQLTGYKREELVGHTSVQLGLVMDPEKRQSFLEKIDEVKQDSYFTTRFRNRSGNIIDINASGSLIKIRNEDYYLIIYYDISELKGTEEKLKNKISELANTNSELEQYVFANQELKQFAYTASHQLQEPIRTASNYVKIIEEDYSDKLDNNVISYLHIINDATTRMSVLINTLLEFSRLGRDTKLVKVDCNSFIESVIADLEYVIKPSGAIIEIGKLPELPLYLTECKQLIQNLIINAIKFQKKGNKPKISITAGRTGDKWSFSVRDNGIGIDPAYFNKIFDIFQRLHINELEYEGKGVGLAFCKKIVQLHRGEIWVDSVPGEGSVFHFTIPELKEI